MQIVSSLLQLTSQRQAEETSIEREKLRVWIGNPGNPARDPAQQAAARFIRDDVQLSQAAQAAQPVKKQGEMEEEIEPLAHTKLQALIAFVEHLTGKKIKFYGQQEMKEAKENTKELEHEMHDIQARGDQRRAGFGIEYDYYAARIEEEHTQFNAEGTVKTADGKEIHIELQLNMSRRFMEEQSISIRAGDAQLKDPLVLNFNGTAAELGEEKFTFDLDADGREEQVSVLSSNSGFLALDKNQDGTINDGSELFGAQSGNGFADLAAYDKDGNQWIDENDTIYDRLRIWTRDAEGNDQLFALGQKNIGAIYLGNISTAFDLKNTATNELQGQIVSSGLFLKESGGAGTVQQINLVV